MNKNPFLRSEPHTRDAWDDGYAAGKEDGMAQAEVMASQLVPMHEMKRLEAHADMLAEALNSVREELTCSGTDSRALWRFECDCPGCVAARLSGAALAAHDARREGKGGVL